MVNRYRTGNERYRYRRLAAKRINLVEVLVGDYKSTCRPWRCFTAYWNEGLVCIAADNQLPALAVVCSCCLSNDSRHAWCTCHRERPFGLGRENNRFRECDQDGVKSACVVIGFLENGNACERGENAVCDSCGFRIGRAMICNICCDLSRGACVYRNQSRVNGNDDLVQVYKLFGIKRNLDRIGHSFDKVPDAVKRVVFNKLVRKHDLQLICLIVAVRIDGENRLRCWHLSLGKERLLRNIVFIVWVGVDDLNCITCEERNFGSLVPCFLGMVDRFDRSTDKVSRIVGVSLQNNFQDIVLFLVDDLDFNRGGLALDLVLVHQVDIECRAFWICWAYDRIALRILDDKCRCCSVALREVYVVSSIQECATTVFGTFIACWIWTGKDGDVNFVTSDTHFHRNIKVPHVCG